MGAVILIVAVVLIVLALVYYLVSVIVALQKIAIGLDETITAVGEIIEKTAPVAPVVDDINANLDAAVSALEGLLVKKAGMADAVGLVEGLYPGAAAQGFRDFPDSADHEGAADLDRLHPRHAHARAAGTRGPDRRRQPQRPGTAQRGRRQPGGPRALSRGAAGPLAGHRHQRPRPIRGIRCRPQHRLSTSGRRRSRVRSPRCASTRTRGSSPAGTRCCR